MADPRARTQLARAEAAIAIVRRLPPRAAFAREMRRVRRAEIHGSTALAGSHLSAAEVDALLDRERAEGNHPFDDYVLVRAYAEAAGMAVEARSYPIGDARPLLELEELRQLNARAAAGSGLRGGAWRQGNLVPAAGIVAPAAWLVAREVTALLDRFGRGPGDSPIALWLARFYGRFARLQPFEGANGRTARLAANLMLRRLDVVPVVFERRDRARFPAALAGAASTDPGTLAAIVANAIVRTCNGVSAAATIAGSTVAPLRAVAGDDDAALAKAAQRGRLRTIVRGGRYYTTVEWIAEYQLRRPSRPVPPRVRPTS